MLEITGTETLEANNKTFFQKCFNPQLSVLKPAARVVQASNDFRTL